jgi:hypothetical protein
MGGLATLPEQEVLHDTTHSGWTPFMHVLYGAMQASTQHWCPVPFAKMEKLVHSALQHWLTVLKSAGINLTRYGRKEAKLFRMYGDRLRNVLWSFSIQHLDIIGFTFGSSTADWGLLIAHPGDCYARAFWDTIEHPERAMPGAWEPGDDSVDFEFREPMSARSWWYGGRPGTSWYE